MPTQNGKARKQELFLASLLSGASVRKAATDAGVSERTAYNWLAADEFQKRYREIKAELVTRAVNRVLRMMDRAAGTMARIMNDRKAPVNVRLRAAARLFDRGLRAHEIDNLAARIEQLEKELPNG